MKLIKIPHAEREINLQMSSSLVFVCENTSGLYNIFSSSLTPWDLLWIPKDYILFNIQSSGYVQKGDSKIFQQIGTNSDILLLPDTKNCNSLLTKEKSLGVLNLHVFMLPLAVNTVVLEHVGLLHKTNKQKTPFRIQQLFEEEEEN